MARNPAAFALRYGDSPNVVGEFFSGGLSNGGERIAILDAFGQTVTEVSYDDNALWPQAADGSGASLQLIAPDTTPADATGKAYSWRSSVEYGGSPGANGIDSVPVRINEVLAHTDPPASDAIELYNAGSTAIDISGWYLSDSDENLRKFAIPAGTVLEAGQYVVFDESDFNVDLLNAFALSSSNGDEVWLTRADADDKLSMIDDVHFDASRNGESFGRDARGWLTPMQSTTLGAENGAPRVGEVIITEVNYNPSEPSAAALALEPTLTSGDLEFIEIHNSTNTQLDLTDWRVRGGAEHNFAFGEMIAAGETAVLIRFDPTAAANAQRLAAFRSNYGIDDSVRLIGGYGGQLAGDGERITLLRPDTTLLNEPIVLPSVSGRRIDLRRSTALAD